MSNFEGETQFNPIIPTSDSEYRAAAEDSAQEKEDILNDLKKVGPEKPLGYLPISTLQEEQIDLQAFREELKQRGLKTMILSQKESDVESGALFAYDEKSLRQLLKENEMILKAANWPSDPQAFIRFLKTGILPGLDPYTGLSNLIAKAFGNKGSGDETKK